MEKVGITFEELGETEMMQIHGGVTPTTITLSSWGCAGLSFVVSAGISGAVTFIVSATYKN